MIHKLLNQHLNDHPVCEQCNKQNSETLSKFGTIKAVCWKCYNEEQQEFYNGTLDIYTGVPCPMCNEPYLIDGTKVEHCQKCGHTQSYWTG